MSSCAQAPPTCCESCGPSWTLPYPPSPPLVQPPALPDNLTLQAKEVGVLTLGELDSDAMFALVEKGLPYMRAVVMEAMRLHPPVPRDLKFATVDDTLPDGTRIRKGCGVLYCPWAMGRDPTLWPEPLRFNPERWLAAGSGEAGSLHRSTQESDYKYPVFNAGPRVCIGRPLAMLETQLMAAVLLSEFDLAPTPACADERYVSSIVSPPLLGVPVVPRRRTAAAQ